MELPSISASRRQFINNNGITENTRTICGLRSRQAQSNQTHFVLLLLGAHSVSVSRKTKKNRTIPRRTMYAMYNVQQLRALRSIVSWIKHRKKSNESLYRFSLFWIWRFGMLWCDNIRRHINSLKHAKWIDERTASHSTIHFSSPPHSARLAFCTRIQTQKGQTSKRLS